MIKKVKWKSNQDDCDHCDVYGSFRNYILSEL